MTGNVIVSITIIYQKGAAMSSKSFLPGIDFNSPVILGLFFTSLILYFINGASNGGINSLLACYYTAWSDPMQYLRLFTHVLLHKDMSHFAGNYMLMLAVGPLIEEKYGGRNLMKMVVFTAVASGLIHIIMFRRASLIGASGLVFMMILLASFTNIREGRLPLTVMLVAFLYIGNEILGSLLTTGNISRLTHIAGATCGAGFGFHYHGKGRRA